MLRHNLSLRSRPQLERQQGFTLIEVLVALSVLILILAGMTSAVTASMRLSVVQHERALAQDLVRDVMSKYIKGVTFDDPDSSTGDLTPFDNNPPASNSSITETVYNTTGTNKLADFGYDGTADSFEKQLKQLGSPVLQVIYYPIKKSTNEYFTTKLNLVVRLSWDNNKRVVQIPTVVGQGDVSRTSRANFEKPTVPVVEDDDDCAGEGVTPSGGLSCCSGLTMIGGICKDVSKMTCTPAGVDKDLTGNLACCPGNTADSDGVCVADSAPSCTQPNQLRANNSGAPCCDGSADNGAGLCVTQPVCSSAGQAPASSSSGTCCSPLRHDTTTNTCISCINAGSKPPGGVASLCCSGKLQGSKCDS